MRSRPAAAPGSGSPRTLPGPPALAQPPPRRPPPPTARSASPMPHSGWAAASASSTTGSNQPSSKPVAARAAGCSSPGPARSTPHAAGASPDPATSARRPAAPRHAPGLSATTPELSAPPDPLTSPDPLTRLFQHSTDPHHKQKHLNTRLQERQYECTVPDVADRVAQTAAVMALEPEVEPVFHDDSYGYRPGRSPLDAVEVCRERCMKRDWVIDLDIKAFFDTVPFDLILRAVARHTDQKWILLYV